MMRDDAVPGREQLLGTTFGDILIAARAAVERGLPLDRRDFIEGDRTRVERHLEMADPSPKGEGGGHAHSPHLPAAEDAGIHALQHAD